MVDPDVTKTDMNQKYPKFGRDYEDDYWRKLADRQAFNRKAIIVVLITVIAIGLWLKANPEHIPKLEIRNIWSTTPTMQFPISGTTMLYQQNNDPKAKFTLASEQGKTENCIVKLEDWKSGISVIELYVRAGEKAETNVPIGEFRARIACGENWYGRSEMFGKRTIITIGIQPLIFWQSKNTIHGNVLNLSKTPAGNFKTTESYSGKF